MLPCLSLHCPLLCPLTLYTWTMVHCIWCQSDIQPPVVQAFIYSVNTSLVQTSRCGSHYESRAFHFGWMTELLMKLRTRTTQRSTQFVLRGWDHFRIVQPGRLIYKILFMEILVSLYCQQFAKFLVTNVLQHMVYIDMFTFTVWKWIMWSWFL